MWLHLPPEVSTPSPSAPEEPDSTLPSNWRFLALERSVWWRGSPSPWRLWSRRCDKVIWLSVLSGQMPRPLEAARGVERWISSLPDIHANPSPSPVVGVGSMTPDISGPISAEPSSRSGRDTSSLRTSLDTSRSASTSSTENFADLASRLRLASSRRQKQAGRTSASASSSSPFTTAAGGEGSAWPTPATRDYKGANGPDHLENGTGRLHLDQLPNFVAHSWSTHRASDGAKGGPNQSFGGGGVPLPAQAAQWPTPTTDSTTERTGRYAQGGPPLTAAVSMWDTPSVADVTGGRTSRSGDRKDELLLNSMAAKVSAESWPTPALTDSNGARNRTAVRSDPDSKHHDGVTLNDAIILYSPPGPETETHGDGSPSTDPTSSRLSLNARFVEWLMGWPPGWTNFACSVMAFTLYRERMRSELWRLPWRAEAVPAQLSLFD